MRSLTALAALAFAAPALAQDFPETLETERGPVTIGEVPERIVAVGVHELWGEKPYATWPWAEAARQVVGAEPEVLMGWEISAEWVASLQPDLIVATYFGDLTEEDHMLLSQIAPVLTAAPGTPRWGVPWREALRPVASATGTSERAEEIIADLDAQLAAVRAAHPELEGETAATGYHYQGSIQTYNSADAAHRFPQDFGLVIPPKYDELANDRGGLDVILEGLSLIDLDLSIFPDEPIEAGELAQLSTFQALDLAREARAIKPWRGRARGGLVLPGAPGARLALRGAAADRGGRRRWRPCDAGPPAQATE